MPRTSRGGRIWTPSAIPIVHPNAIWPRSRPPGTRTGGRNVATKPPGGAVVTETTDPPQPRVAFRCCSELEAKGTEFYSGTLPLIATKEPPNRTNQPGHRSPPSCGGLGLARGLR